MPSILYSCPKHKHRKVDLGVVLIDCVIRIVDISGRLARADIVRVVQNLLLLYELHFAFGLAMRADFLKLYWTPLLVY